MGKHDREKDQDEQVPADKPIPKGNWVKEDNGGRHRGGQQREQDKREDDEK